MVFIAIAPVLLREMPLAAELKIPFQEIHIRTVLMVCWMIRWALRRRRRRLDGRVIVGSNLACSYYYSAFRSTRQLISVFVLERLDHRLHIILDPLQPFLCLLFLFGRLVQRFASALGTFDQIVQVCCAITGGAVVNAIFVRPQRNIVRVRVSEHCLTACHLQLCLRHCIRLLRHLEPILNYAFSVRPFLVGQAVILCGTRSGRQSSLVVG
jgi:hypothetical protein